jgi:hypothetical protein
MRTLRAALILSVAAAVCLPSAASAQSVKKFYVQAKGTQTIDWHQAKAYGTHTCFGSSWVEGGGTEKFTFENAKKARLLAYRSNRYLYFEYNSWRKGQNPYEDGFKVRTSVERSGDYQRGQDAGACGGGKPAESNGPYDCGVKPSTMYARLSDVGGKLSLTTSHIIGYPYQDFRTCPIDQPAGASAENLTTIEWPYSLKKLMASKKPVVIHARKSISQLPSGEGTSSSTARIDWTVKLTPVGR